jgi:hypothetical protein
MPDRILTSHAGSLPRPEDLIALNERRAEGDLSAYLSRLRGRYDINGGADQRRPHCPHGGFSCSRDDGHPRALRSAVVQEGQGQP